MVKTKSLSLVTEYELIIGNIAGAKWFCVQDKLDEKKCMICGGNQKTKKISYDNSMHTKPGDSRNKLYPSFGN